MAAYVLRHRARLMAAFSFGSFALGGVLHLVGHGAAGDHVWAAAVALLAVELLIEVARTVVIEHHLGVDAIALIAMVGSLALGEELAGIVVGMMFTGGAALEDWASRR